MTEHRIVHLTISGHVQGVGFRAWLHHHAELQDVAGWVRNRADHMVEAVLSGAPDRIEAIIRACRQGPAGSRVDSVEVGEAADGDLHQHEAEPGGFSVLPSV